MNAADRRRLNGRTPRGLPVKDRFWNKVSGDSVEDCWLWSAALTPGTGYGAFEVATGKRVNAHRWAYEHLISEIPEGLQLDHLCRNRACVNPWHLEPVTPLVNTRRGKGNGSKVNCPQGHPYSEANTYRRRGRRICRACNRARQAEWQDRQANRSAA